MEAETSPVRLNWRWNGRSSLRPFISWFCCQSNVSALLLSSCDTSVFYSFRALVVLSQKPRPAVMWWRLYQTSLLYSDTELNTRCLLVYTKFIKWIACPRNFTLDIALPQLLSSRPTKCEVESEPRSSALLWCDGVYIKQHLSGLLFGNGYLFCALKHNQTFMLYFSHSQAFSLSHSFPTCPSAATVFNINHSHPAFYSWQTETISHIFYPPW